MKNCKICGKEIARSAKVCPHCGAKNKKPIYKRIWVWFLGVIIIFGGLMSCSSEDTSTNNTDVQIEDAKEEVEKVEEKISIGEKNAKEKAESYLKIMDFSKEGLKEQLEFEGFTLEEIEYAVNNCKVDWFEEAAGKADTYLDTMSFSRESLYNQLEFEGFTHEEIEYGLKSVGY